MKTCIDCRILISKARKRCIMCSERKTISTERAARYGLTLGQLNDWMAGKQTCEACGQGAKLVIDHCHKTGQIRGLLCHGCNIAIGHVREKVSTLRALVTYLEKHT